MKTEFSAKESGSCVRWELVCVYFNLADVAHHKQKLVWSVACGCVCVSSYVSCVRLKSSTLHKFRWQTNKYIFIISFTFDMHHSCLMVLFLFFSHFFHALYLFSFLIIACWKLFRMCFFLLLSNGFQRLFSSRKVRECVCALFYVCMCVSFLCTQQEQRT